MALFNNILLRDSELDYNNISDNLNAINLIVHELSFQAGRIKKICFS